MELVIYLKNEQDFIVLEPLLKRMKIRFEQKDIKKKVVVRTKRLLSAQQKLETARVRLLQMHKEGIDVTSYGDPVQWQKDTRQDTCLPFRD